MPNVRKWPSPWPSATAISHLSSCPSADGHVIVMEMPFRGVDTAADSTAGMARSRSRRLSKKARLEATSGYLTVESVIEAVRTLFA